MAFPHPFAEARLADVKVAQVAPPRRAVLELYSPLTGIAPVPGYRRTIQPALSR